MEFGLSEAVLGLDEVDYRSILSALSQVGRVGRDAAEVFRVFGQRGYEAWQLVKDRRLKKYVFKPSGRVQWIVVGEGRDYLIYDAVGYCHCEDFYHAVMKGEAKLCKHLIAWKMAVNLNLYETIMESDENYSALLEDWGKIGGQR
jgi:predicted nucleic acid-binding Zn finger protein